MADQLPLFDAGPAIAEPKPKGRRRKSKFSKKTIELARQLAKRRSPLDVMIDQACGIGGSK